jgi:hypothetical protein
MMSDGILKNATVQKNGRVSGQIYGDKKGRFQDGEWISTSPIQKIVTKNSTYEIELQE